MKNKDWDNLGFELNPADKMFRAMYKNGKWDKGEMLAYGKIPVSPAAVVLNYGQGIFEGMKAFRTKEGKIAMFRPYDNARRLNEGCKRLCMPELDEEFFVQSVQKLLIENEEFVPPYGKGELYIRPMLFGSGEMLGVNPATEYSFVIFMSPVGPYFKGGFNGIRLEIRDDFHRAPLFGSGGVKAIGNYAVSLFPKRMVKSNGYDEVLYLDAKNSTYIEEVGAANIFLLKDGVIATPRLSGSILEGITRDSVLTIAKDRFKLIPQERDIRYDEVFDADEIFCTGTAAVITPIVFVSYRGTGYTIAHGTPGEMTKRLYDELKGIQRGERPESYGWFYLVA